MSEQNSQPLKKKQVFEQSFSTKQTERNEELTAQMQFANSETFVPVEIEETDQEREAQEQLEQIIRPNTKRKWLASGLLAAFSGLVVWQSVDSVIVAIQTMDWLSLGWAAFISTLAGLGIGAIGKELWKLRSLRNHFSVQEKSEALIEANSVGHGRSFCEKLANQAGVKQSSPSYVRWENALNESHSDAEVLELYDSLVIAEQDKRATKVVSQHATESAALVAISPLALADMLLVAWRNFKMIDNLAEIYGVELGYWSRLQLFKSTLINMAVAGASELAVDASMDLMSMDLAGKVSARAGQGLGVGILTARLGIKAMSLLRPTPWHQDRRVKLSAIRKQIVEKIAVIAIK